MIILEDSWWDKLKTFADKKINKIITAQKNYNTEFQKLRQQTAPVNEKLRKALESKPGLKGSLSVWLTALEEMNKPLQSELYDFLMNTEQYYDPRVASLIVGIFEDYRNLTAEEAIDTLDLDRKEFASDFSNSAEMLKLVKEYMKNKKRKSSDIDLNKNKDSFSHFYSLFKGISKEEALKEFPSINIDKVNEEIAEYLNKGQSVLDTKGSIEGLPLSDVSKELLEFAKTFSDSKEFLTKWPDEIAIRSQKGAKK